MTTKLAQVYEVLGQMPDVIEKQAEEIDSLRSKLAELERREEATKVARAAQDKGIDQNVPFDALVEDLSKMASASPEKFAAYRTAVDMYGPDMSAARLVESDRSGSAEIPVGASAFEQFVLS